MTLEEVKKLQVGQTVYYKNLYLYPEEVVVKQVVLSPDEHNADAPRVELTDNCYIPERNFDQIFFAKEECASVCQKELNERLEKLRLMLSKETADFVRESK